MLLNNPTQWMWGLFLFAVLVMVGGACVSVIALRGKAFPRGGVTALRRKTSWQRRAKEYHKVILHNILHTSHRRFTGRDIGGWLSLLGQEAAGNWPGDKLYIRFLNGGSSRVETSRVESNLLLFSLALLFFQTGQQHVAYGDHILTFLWNIFFTPLRQGLTM